MSDHFIRRLLVISVGILLGASCVPSPPPRVFGKPQDGPPKPVHNRVTIYAYPDPQGGDGCVLSTALFTPVVVGDEITWDVVDLDSCDKGYDLAILGLGDGSACYVTDALGETKKSKHVKVHNKNRYKLPRICKYEITWGPLQVDPELEIKKH